RPQHRLVQQRELAITLVIGHDHDHIGPPAAGRVHQSARAERGGRQGSGFKETASLHMSPVSQSAGPEHSSGGMQRIAGGTFRMGSERFYSEEQPTRYVSVETFWIDVTPVSNRDFAAFVAATGYRTLAERACDPSQYPDADPASLAAASMVFSPPSQ